MPLVKEKTYMKWTKRDHPIRKNFNYFFNNPIWQKEPPEMFSLCPFFWTSMLGLIGLKLFLVPIWRLSSLLAAGTLGMADKGLYCLWKSSMEMISKKEWEYETGKGFCPTIITGISILALYIISYGIGSSLFDLWHSTDFLGRWGYFGFTANLLVWAICIVYILFCNKTKEERCRVEWYAVATMTVWIIPWAFFGRFEIGRFLSIILSYVVRFLSWLASLFPGGGYAWVLYVVGGLVVIYCLAIFVDKVFYKTTPLPVVVKKWEITRDMLIDMMAVHLSHEEGHRLDILISYTFGELPREIMISLRRVAAKALLIKQDSMNHVESIKINEIIREDIKSSDKIRSEWDRNFSKVCDGDTCYGSSSYYSSYYLERVVQDTYVIPEVRDAVEKELKEMEEYVKITKAALEEKTEAQKIRDDRCKMVVSFVSAPFRFIGSLASYCWDVFKAKKEGFCPLLTLEPMEEKEEEAS
jgi:hypothetical protein